MRKLREALMRIGGLFDKARADQDLRDELQTHLALHVEDNLRAGMSPDEAHRQARLSLGGVEQTHEQYRDSRGLPFFDHLAQDLRYGLRALRRNPGFTAAAVVTLALGIGANTAMFSFADATAFRPPDVPRPDEVARVFDTTKEAPYGRVSYPDYVDYRDCLTTFSGVLAYDTGLVAMSKSRNEIPELLGLWVVSGNFFSVLEVNPALGRGLHDEDDQPRATPVAVISHHLWERRFAADPAVIGTRMILGTTDFTIVGVAPAAFAGTELYFHPDLYVSLAMTPFVDTDIAATFRENRSHRWLNVLGRIRPGARVSSANAEVVAVARSLEQAYPSMNRDHTAVVIPEVSARGKLDEGDYQGAGLLLALTGLVLLIACANVANLMLARSTGRTKEIAVRLALGASRGRLIRQLLTESVLLASVGGVVGLVVAHLSVRYLSAMFVTMFSLTDIPVYVDARVDQRVLLYTVGVSMATGILFGLVPAWQATRIALIPALKASTNGSGRRRRLNVRTLLVGSEVALSVIVLTVAGVSIRAFLDHARADPGFRTDHTLLMSFGPNLVRYSQDQTQQFYEQIVGRAKAVPGVTAVGLAASIPLGFTGGGSETLVVDGYRTTPGQNRLSVMSNIVDAGYWTAMRTRIVRGRPFDERDTSTSESVVIINETMAQRYWPNREALGAVVHLQDLNGRAVQVVGIAQDVSSGSLGESPQPYLFLPLSQHFRTSMTMVVLAKFDPASLVSPIRAEVQALGGNVPMFDIRTLDSLYQSRALLAQRLISQIMTTLGMLALALAIVGLYGVIAYLTALRAREIGIRMAVGADRNRVLLLVLQQAVPMVGPGLIVGIGLAFLLTPALAVPFDFVPHDGAVLTLVPVVLTAAAFVASLIPARRAAMVNPTVALRDE